MILSYNVPQNKDDSSDNSVKEENYKDIKYVVQDSHKGVEPNKSGFSQNNISGWEVDNVSLSNSSQISKIEHKNSSVSLSLREGLSHAEECIQKDVLLIIDQDSIRKTKENINPEGIEKKSSIEEEDKIIDVSNEVSFNSQKSKNYILKSSLMHSIDNAKPNDSKDTSLKKCFNYYINKPSTNSEEKVYDKTSSKTDNILQNENTLYSGLNYNKGIHINTHNIFRNESDDIIHQMDYLSIQKKIQNKINNNSYPFDYQNTNQQQLQQGRIISFTPQDEQKTQFNKQAKSRFESSNDNDLILNCFHYAKEQTGCRLLQKLIDDNPNVVDDKLYPIISNQFVELSCDSFGNYFIQKILSFLSLDKIEKILQMKIQNSFRMMSLNPHGTRVIQKIFERVIKDEKLLSYYTLLLKPNLKDFFVDPNASHIIIQYASLIASPQNDFIVDFLCQNAQEIATQKHSCCALQKCIESVNPQQKKKLFTAVAMNSFNLFADQYGNYVVQFIINACDYEINHMLMVNFLRDFEQFSIQKYSSNVIEKCLSCCSEETKELIVKHLCNPQLVQHLLFDMYGNYVLQKGMSISKEPYKTELFHYVGSIIEKLQFVSFGPKLYNKLISSFPELSQYMKNEKSAGTFIKRKGTNIINNTNKMKQKHNNMIPQIAQSPPIHPLSRSPIASFQNYGNVYYQANPMFNPYQQMPNMPNSNYMQMQYMQQAMNSGIYMPMQNNMMNPNTHLSPNLNQRGFVNNMFKNNYYQ